VGRFKSVAVLCLCGVAVCVMFLSYGCTPPPTKEIADAEAALSAAREAGAETYAAQEYASAESKLEEARRKNEEKCYGEAKGLAIEAKDGALNAMSIAEHERMKLREQAAAALKNAKESLVAAKVAGAETHDPQAYRKVEALYGEADTAYISGQYPIAIEKAEEVTKRARRLELAAKRATEIEPQKVVEQPKAPETEKQAGNHVVQKGECLWIISDYDVVYADPFKWPLIYRANRSQIKDPDLIHPGQSFKIPRNYSPQEANDAIYTAKHRGPWSLSDGK